MSAHKPSAPRALSVADTVAALRRQYACGPVDLTGGADALYERPLFFDNVIASINGLKIVTPGGWFAARPSGTEDIYKIYAESFRSAAHLDALVSQAHELVDALIGDRR